MYSRYKKPGFKRWQARRSARKIQRAWRRRAPSKRNVKSNKQLTRDVRRLWTNSAIKQHYVQDSATTAVATPAITELTGIGQGESSNNHEGNKIKLRSLDIHGYTQVVYTGGVPSISKATRWNVIILRTTLDTGLAGVPSYSLLFDQNGPPLLADFDGFRALNSETLEKVKIVYKKSFTLAPQRQDANPSTNTSTHPDFVHWTINLKLGNAMIEYREGSSVALNAQYYIMLKSFSTGAAGNLGLQHTYYSKLTFRDVE